MSLEELKIVYYNNIDCISELTCSLWEQVEERRRVNGLFKDKGEMYVLVRHKCSSPALFELVTMSTLTCVCVCVSGLTVGGSFL